MYEEISEIDPGRGTSNKVLYRILSYVMLCCAVSQLVLEI